MDEVTIGRRRLLGFLGGAVVLAACGGEDGGGAGTAATTASDEPIPEETAGPFPGDGSNGPNVLDDDGVVRRDIRSSFGTSTTTAEGIPLEVELVCPGAAVYLWHCDRDGNYSMYSPGVEGENYLRGVQVAGDDGVVRFTTIYPGCYSGRWPHIHFEVYGTVEDAVQGGAVLATSQLAFPQATCDEAYATAGYESSVGNLARLSLQTDNVFGDDGAARQLTTMSGDPATGYTARLDVPV